MAGVPAPAPSRRIASSTSCSNSPRYADIAAIYDYIVVRVPAIFGGSAQQRGRGAGGAAAASTVRGQEELAGPAGGGSRAGGEGRTTRATLPSPRCRRTR